MTCQYTFTPQPKAEGTTTTHSQVLDHSKDTVGSDKPTKAYELLDHTSF